MSSRLCSEVIVLYVKYWRDSSLRIKGWQLNSELMCITILSFENNWRCQLNLKVWRAGKESPSQACRTRMAVNLTKQSEEQASLYPVLFHLRYLIILFLLLETYRWCHPKQDKNTSAWKWQSAKCSVPVIRSAHWQQSLSVSYCAREVSDF